MSREWSIFVYNPDVLREQFANLVIQRGLPFNHFDDEQTTGVFQKHLQPKYNHVSRTTIKRDAMKLCVAAKQAIINDFLKLNTNVKLTMDVWSAPHGVSGSYIYVTAHWIEPASEFAFSTSGRVLSIRKTRLTPASLEMCMCLKDHLDAQERKQDKSTFETPVDFEEKILDAEVQANEAIPLSDEEIALDAASSECSMSGPSSEGEEAEAEVNYGYDVYHDDY
nr:zinc finger BED domain-containing protein RICESLEEPER 2-like [Tanacetum cinerariifolium]